jgi:hypothetical protein
MSGARARVAWRLVLAVALIVLAAVALSGAIGPIQGGVMMMLPAFLLMGVMLTRPYLGEGVITRLRTCRRRRLSVASPARRPLGSPTRVARGGRLIALALAGRAPPFALAACR